MTFDLLISNRQISKQQIWRIAFKHFIISLFAKHLTLLGNTPSACIKNTKCRGLNIFALIKKLWDHLRVPYFIYLITESKNQNLVLELKNIFKGDGVTIVWILFGRVTASKKLCINKYKNNCLINKNLFFWFLKKLGQYYFFNIFSKLRPSLSVIQKKKIFFWTQTRVNKTKIYAEKKQLKIFSNKTIQQLVYLKLKNFIKKNFGYSKINFQPIKHNYNKIKKMLANTPKNFFIIYGEVFCKKKTLKLAKNTYTNIFYLALKSGLVLISDKHQNSMIGAPYIQFFPYFINNVILQEFDVFIKKTNRQLVKRENFTNTNFSTTAKISNSKLRYIRYGNSFILGINETSKNVEKFWKNLKKKFNKKSIFCLEVKKIILHKPQQKSFPLWGFIFKKKIHMKSINQKKQTSKKFKKILDIQMEIDYQSLLKKLEILGFIRKRLFHGNHEKLTYKGTFKGSLINLPIKNIFYYYNFLIKNIFCHYQFIFSKKKLLPITILLHQSCLLTLTKKFKKKTILKLVKFFNKQLGSKIKIWDKKNY